MVNNECYSGADTCPNSHIDLVKCSESLETDHFCCPIYFGKANFCDDLISKYPKSYDSDGTAHGCTRGFGNSTNSCLQKNPDRPQRIDACSQNYKSIYSPSYNFCCTEDVIPIVPCDYLGAPGCSNTVPPTNAPTMAPTYRPFPEEKCDALIEKNGCQYSSSSEKPITSVYDDTVHDWINVEECTHVDGRDENVDPEKSFFWCPMVGPNSQSKFCPFQDGEWWT